MILFMNHINPAHELNVKSQQTQNQLHVSPSSLLQVTVALISFLETMLITYLSYKVRTAPV